MAEWTPKNYVMYHSIFMKPSISFSFVAPQVKNEPKLEKGVILAYSAGHLVPWIQI